MNISDKWKRPNTWLNQISEENPENLHQTVQELGDKMEAIQRTVQAIVIALERHGIKLEY